MDAGRPELTWWSEPPHPPTAMVDARGGAVGPWGAGERPQRRTTAHRRRRWHIRRRLDAANDEPGRSPDQRAHAANDEPGRSPDQRAHATDHEPGRSPDQRAHATGRVGRDGLAPGRRIRRG